jgi:hypothetical protein
MEEVIILTLDGGDFLCNPFVRIPKKLRATYPTPSGARPVNLHDLKRSLRALTPDQLRRLDAWLHELIEQASDGGRDQLSNGRDAPEKRQAGQKTYRLEHVRCGSKKCKCISGELHGPYWYAYWSEGGRTKSQYVGKKLPAKKKR